MCDPSPLRAPRGTDTEGHHVNETISVSAIYSDTIVSLYGTISFPIVSIE